MGFPTIIYLTGIDGCGKTTVVDWLAKTLRSKGYPVTVLWLRFNHVLSKPLLGLCRIMGLTTYRIEKGVRVGYHEFQDSPVISRLFIVLQYLDAALVRWFRIGPRLLRKNQIIILDRYVYDILIDLMVDTGIDELWDRWAGRAIVRLVPKDALVLALSRDAEDLLRARPESEVDKNFSKRLELYEQISQKYNLDPVRNSGSRDELLARVAERVGIQ
jgi:thymidylate kinase